MKYEFLHIFKKKLLQENSKRCCKINSHLFSIVDKNNIFLLRSRFIWFVFLSLWLFIFYLFLRHISCLTVKTSVSFFSFFDFNFAISASDFMNLWRLRKYACEMWKKYYRKKRIIKTKIVQLFSFALHKSSFFLFTLFGDTCNSKE